MQAGLETFNQQPSNRVPRNPAIPLHYTCKSIAFWQSCAIFRKKGHCNNLTFGTVNTLAFWTPRSGPPQCHANFFSMRNWRGKRMREENGYNFYFWCFSVSVWVFAPCPISWAPSGQPAHCRQEQFEGYPVHQGQSCCACFAFSCKATQEVHPACSRAGRGWEQVEAITGLRGQEGSGWKAPFTF